MSLTKAPLNMIDPGADAEAGDVVKSDGKDLTPQKDTTAAEAVALSGGSYDPETGTLTLLNEDGSKLTIDGFPVPSALGEGPQGERGLQGQTGRSGRDGKDGSPGDQGCIGPKGDRGQLGPTGSTGPQGNTGSTGPTGDTGPQGEVGPQGDDAVAPIYNVILDQDEFTDEPIPGAYIGYEVDQQTGRITNFGRVRKSSSDTIQVHFGQPFINRVASLVFTFENPQSLVAQKYRLTREDLEVSEVIENLELGGFTLKVELDIGEELEDTDLWDFFWVAIGD